MSQGVLLFAKNNAYIDYVKQAMFCAERIKKYLNLPVCLATDDIRHLPEDHNLYFDKVIEQAKYSQEKQKKFYDGNNYMLAQWYNLSRPDAYDLSPFDETIVMDTDLIISNDALLECFSSNENFMIARYSKDINTKRKIKSFEKISDKSINMFWATLFYFKKDDQIKILFDLIKHIRENYNFYRLTYKITETKFRNDFAFSIAIHIINKFQNSSWPKEMPTNLWHILDTDLLIDIDQDKLTFLIGNEKKYILSSVKGLNVHVMNKFSLGRVIDEKL